MNASHIPQLTQIAQESYPEPWTANMFLAEITNPIAHFYVVEINNEVVAYGGYWLVNDEAEIVTLTVSKAYRNKGIGRMLLRYLITHAHYAGATRIFLEVRQNNFVAQHLYLSEGFYIVGKRKAYYNYGTEDAIIMRCDLGSNTNGNDNINCKNAS